MKGLIKWIGIALVACVVLAVVASLLSDDNKDSGTANVPAVQQTQPEQSVSAKANADQPTEATMPTNTPKSEPSPTPAPGVGQEVVVGNVAWKVIEAKALGDSLKSDNQFIEDETTSGMFVAVSYQIENRDTSKQYFEAPKLVDAQDREFSDYSDALFFIPEKEQCVFKELNPNVPAACTVIYEVAADAKQLKAEATSLSLFGSSTLINLGLE